MVTSTGDVMICHRWGRVAFEVEGQAAELTLYMDQERGDLSLPFADATSDHATYGASRYL